MRTLFGDLYFDKSDAPLFCWKVTQSNNTVFYSSQLTEKYATHFLAINGNTIIKTTCGTCEQWLLRSKYVYKPSGLATYGVTQKQQFCGDTVSTLYKGWLITYRETADSVYYHEFVDKQ